MWIRLRADLITLVYLISVLISCDLNDVITWHAIPKNRMHPNYGNKTKFLEGKTWCFTSVIYKALCISLPRS
jgi:hypothetical protein